MRLFNNGNVALDKWTAVHSLALLHICGFVAGQWPREKFILWGEHIKIETMSHSVVILIFYNNPYEMTFCSVLAHRWVLTAAHCVKDVPNKVVLVKIRLGIDAYSQEGLVHDVEKKVCHWQFRPGYTPADICLLQTFDEIPFSNRVQPVARPGPSETVQSVDKVRVAGWGQSQHFAVWPPYLSAVDLYRISDSDCDQDIPAELSREKPGSFFCAGRKVPYAKSVCHGDSGSAAVIRSYDNESWVALGVTVQSKCRGPSVFMPVHFFNEWIMDTLRRYS